MINRLFNFFEGHMEIAIVGQRIGIVRQEIGMLRIDGFALVEIFETVVEFAKIHADGAKFAQRPLIIRIGWCSTSWRSAHPQAGYPSRSAHSIEPFLLHRPRDTAQRRHEIR